MPVDCNIHPFMKGHLLVQDHPYMAVSGEDGTFEIKNIPAGKHEFQFWHEAAGYLKNLKLNRRRDRSPRPGQAHDRRRQDARPGRHQSAGQHVEAK